MLWLVPMTAVTTFVSVVILRSPNHEDLVAIVGIVLAVLGIAIALGIYRIQGTNGGTPNPPATISPRWHALSYVFSAVLVAASFVYPFPESDDDPAVFFGKDEIRIGVNGRLPGWSLSENGSRTGFDIRLAQFLMRKFGVDPERVRYVDLSQEMREHQWDGTVGEAERVDLVISAFSMTALRLDKFGMAGPYYIDVSNVFTNREKGPVPRNSQDTRGCAVAGTTGLSAMDEQKERLLREQNAVLTIDHPRYLNECFEPFFDPADPTRFIASDWSVIRAFQEPDDPTILTVDDSQEPVFDMPEPAATDPSRQLYGVAIPPHHPTLCRALTNAIHEFVNTEWDTAFRETLGHRKLTAGWHKPRESEFTLDLCLHKQVGQTG
jgi:ABC-type amino acid transport substrate-binding protein